MRVRSLVLAATVLGSMVACAGGDPDGQGDAGQAGGNVDLTGAGATFPYPLYSRWFADYARQTNVRINYGSLGSGAGIRQVSEGTVDFGATDSPMTEKELAAAKGGHLLHIPTVAGAVVVAYNLPDITQPLRLSGELIADIFLGQVVRWNDPRIAAINPGVQLPDRDILVVHRTDGSGTTFVFTDYMSSVSQAWANGPGRGKQVNWPTGLGGKGNEGVAAQVQQMPGAIGYTEVAFARQTDLQVALVRNQARNYVAPTVEHVQAAAEGVLDQLPPDTDFRVSIVNAPGDSAYPIAALTWILIYENQQSPVKGARLVEFLRWALTEGGEQATALDYAPLPPRIAERVLQRLDSVRVGG